jgi:hypothetical protein
MALGADHQAVVWMVLRQALRLGVSIGLVAAFYVCRAATAAVCVGVATCQSAGLRRHSAAWDTALSPLTGRATITQRRAALERSLASPGRKFQPETVEELQPEGQ